MLLADAIYSHKGKHLRKASVSKELLAKYGIEGLWARVGPDGEGQSFERIRTRNYIRKHNQLKIGESNIIQIQS